MNAKIETLQNLLNNFITDYQKEPIKYFYEEDLRAELLITLSHEEIYDIDLPLTERNEWLKDYETLYNKKTSVSSIKAEYPSNTRFDIACINPDLIDENKSYNHYIFDCLFAIEIKLSQKDNQNFDLKQDIEKLKNYKNSHQVFTGIAINFEQNPNYNNKKVMEDYNNSKELKFIELLKPISISENKINYFFISKEYVLGGTIDAVKTE